MTQKICFEKSVNMTVVSLDSRWGMMSSWAVIDETCRVEALEIRVVYFVDENNCNCRLHQVT